MKHQKYAWVTALPAVWLLICTLTAGIQKIFHSDPGIGFIAHAHKFGAAVDQGQIIAPAKSLDQMRHIVFNDYVDASLSAAFVFVVLATLFYGIISARRALANPKPTANEVGPATALNVS
jgi:carbon starvation protein